MPSNLKLRFSTSVYLPYIGIAEKVNTEKVLGYQRILVNTENFRLNKLLEVF